MDREKIQRAVAEVAKLAGSGGSPTRPTRSAYSDLVMEVVEPNHLSLELFSAFLPTRTMKPGDRRGKRVRRGKYPVRTFVPKDLGL